MYQFFQVRGESNAGSQNCGLAIIIIITLSMKKTTQLLQNSLGNFNAENLVFYLALTMIATFSLLWVSRHSIGTTTLGIISVVLFWISMERGDKSSKRELA